MSYPDSHLKGYTVAALLGAIGGGLAVALATRAIPKIMTRVLADMTQNMMAQMQAGSGTPSEQ